MTRDEINRLIQDNDLFHGTMKLGVIMDMNHLERFAVLVAAAEREACLDWCAAYAADDGTAQKIAAAIRARGEK